MHQPRVGDLGADEVRALRCASPAGWSEDPAPEVHQPRIGDLGAEEGLEHHLVQLDWSAPPDAPAPRR